MAILILLVCAITLNPFPFSGRSAITSNKTPESSPDPSTNQRIGFILSRFALQFLRFNSSFCPATDANESRLTMFSVHRLTNHAPFN